MSTQQLADIDYRPREHEDWSNYQIIACVDRVIEFIKQEPDFFLLLAQIMREYRNPDVDEETKQDRNDDIAELIAIDPKLKNKDAKTVELFQSLIDDLYSEQDARTDKVRGNVLEAIIYHFGPKCFDRSSSTQKFLDAQIYHNGQQVGGNNCDFDFVFHEELTERQADYFECKATIEGTALPPGTPIDQMNRKRKKKLDFAKEVHHYFQTNTTFRPTILFACFNAEVTGFQKFLAENDLGCVEIMDAGQLNKMILRKS